MEAQQTPLEPESVPVEASEPPAEAKPAPPLGSIGNLKLKPIDRNRLLVRETIVDRQVGPKHPVRAIWDLVGLMDLSPFLGAIRSRQGEKGRPSTDPQLLVSVWIYAYSEGISSAREIERLMRYEPGLVWL